MWFDGLWCIPIDFGAGKRNKRRLAEFKNAYAFQLAFARFLNDALRRYDFDGLPETLNKRVILQSLLWHANIVFFEKGGNLFALPAAPTGDLNVYGEPASAEVFSLNGMLNEKVELFIHGSDEDAFLKKTDTINTGKYKGVMVWENNARYPFINAVIYYAQQVSDTFRTLDVCRQNIKNPQMFFCEESVVNTVKKYLEDRESNVANIIGTGVFDPTKVAVVPIDAHGTQLSDVTALIEWYEAKFRELCGINNNSQMDKKGENLIQAEVSVNDEYTFSSVEKCMEVMQQGLDDVNKIFGTNITVKEVENENISADDNRGENNLSADGGLGSSSDNT
jgi:hypothetical protein